MFAPFSLSAVLPALRAGEMLLMPAARVKIRRSGTARRCHPSGALPMNGLPVGTMLGTENGPLLKVEGRAFWPGWERAVFLARAVPDIPEGTYAERRRVGVRSGP